MTERTRLLAKVDAWLDLHPSERMVKLEELIAEERVLWTTAEVSAWTGWSENHVRDLCQAGVLPHIPGSPNRFLRRPLIDAIESLLVGGRFRPRKGNARKALGRKPG